MSIYIGERTRWGTVRVYTAGADPRPVATVRLPDLGTIDDTLAEYGYRVIGDWARSDDMPPGHAVASIERFRSVAPDEPAVDVIGLGTAWPLEAAGPEVLGGTKRKG